MESGYTLAQLGLMRDKCKLIASRMTEAGIDNVVDSKAIDYWSFEDCEYMLVNYDSWLED